MNQGVVWTIVTFIFAFALGSEIQPSHAFVGSRFTPDAPFLLMNADPSPEEITQHSLGSQQRYLATGDSAGVVTIWDVENARISRRIYLPFAKDLGGNGITALHLQRQGNLLAVSAKTSLGGQTDSYRVLVFDITTGALRANFPTNNKLVQQVGFSPNGRWLAIQESQGDLSLIDTNTWQEKKRFPNKLVSNYAAPKEIFVWGESGNLYAMSNIYGYGDSENIAFVRKINPDTQEINELVKQGLSIPFRLAISPDERYFALYYREQETWRRLIASTSSNERHYLGQCDSFAWQGLAHDFVCGSKGYRLNVGQSPVEDSNVQYRSPSSPVQVSANLVRFNDATGNERRRFTRAIISEKTLRADAKLQTLLFRLQGKDHTFHLPTRRLSLADQAAQTLNAASPSNASINVASWNGSWDTTINGNKLKELSSYPGGSKLVDVLPNGSGIILGTTYWYVRYDTAGNKIWEIRTKDNPFAHKVAGDSNYFVALFSDGILRWYRARDGQLLLSLYVQAQSNTEAPRWVLWTPSGYYDAAPGAEELIGWHVNRGLGETADFYPASRFRERFYRPDVIDQVLETLDEGQALARADTERGKRTQTIQLGQILPPSIELLSPNEGTFPGDKLSIRLQLRSAADAPITALRVRVNGQMVETRRDLGIVANTASGIGTGIVTGTAQSLDIPLPRQDVEIQVFAENRHGVSSPATLRYRYVGSLMPNPPDVARPKLYVLAIGVSDYDNPNYRLNLAAKDAKDVSDVFAQQKGKLYRDVEVRLLTDKTASRDGIMDGLEWLQRQVTARDVGVLFLAGHGINAPDGAYYFAPVNFNIDSIKRTGVVFNEIKMTLSSLAGKAVFFVDTCHSGNILGAGRRALGDITGIINELSSAENGVVVFSSATGREYALEKPEWGNGAFTKAVVEGLSGKADHSGSGRITHKSLDYYVSERVKVLTNGQQHPVTQAPGGVPDFPLAITR